MHSDGALLLEAATCPDCLITTNQPENGLERARRIIHHILWLYPTKKRRAEARLSSIQFFGSIYAAEAAAANRFFGTSSPSQRTLTSFETPGSCIVTP